MTEKRLLSFIFTEGVLLICFGLGALILPKISFLSFGFLLSIMFIIYGGYRALTSILTKNYSSCYILNMLAGLILLTSGILLFLAPLIDIMIIISVIGVYFILSSLSVSAFGIRGEGILRGRRILFVLSVFEIFLGLIIITTISQSALWFAGILAGIDFLISGIVFIDVYMLTKNTNI